eukprot:m.20795 g.20795  ORF g.20795 m.20795 type:complete len:275 (-) comp6953_c0_seq1:101-925(-)
MGGNVIECKTSQEFSSALTNAGSKLVTVDFTASWCGPCQQISPTYTAMSNEFTNVVFLKVDVDVNRDVASQYGVSSMPTFMFMKQSKVIEKFSGADPKGLRATVIRLKDPPFDIIPDNTAVKLMNLKSEKFNGLTGSIQGYDAQKGRYTVVFDKNQGEDIPERLAVKPINLLQLAQINIISEGDNSTAGKIVNVNNGAYVVEKQGGGMSEIGASDVLLADGTVALTQGLSTEAMNGNWGRIMSHDKESGRYVVQISAEKQLKIKRKNVVVGPLS